MGKAIEIQAPNDFETKKDYKSVFLAGSIENGKAVKWQAELIKELTDENIMFLNPRRADWNADWVQSIKNKEFKLQVTWELTALKFADLIVFYFDPKTKSPITLMELGLHATSPNVIVCCPEPYWKKGNVDVVCELHGIQQVNTVTELAEAIKKSL